MKIQRDSIVELALRQCLESTRPIREQAYNLLKQAKMRELSIAQEILSMSNVDAVAIDLMLDSKGRPIEIRTDRENIETPADTPPPPPGLNGGTPTPPPGYLGPS